MKVSTSELISAPQQRVFEVFSDIEHAAGRISGIQTIEIVSSVRRGQGLRWRETRVVFGKESSEEMEITDFKTPNHYVVEANSHGTHYRSTFSFAKVSDSETRVTWEFHGTPQSLFAKMFAPLAALGKGVVKKMLRKDVLDLKRHIER